MELEMYMEEARHLAAQCWCDETTSDRIMDPQLAEAVARRIAVWMDSAAQSERNAEFYRNLLDQCVANLGPLAFLAYVSDDGSIQDSPLRLKIPELVAKLSQGYRLRENASETEPITAPIDEEAFWRECYPILCKAAAEFNRKHSR